MEKMIGPLLIALAAILWATDAPFRLPALQSLDPVFIVGFEHVIGALIIGAWGAYRFGAELFKLNWKGWLAAIVVGVGGSAFASVLFTASFRYINPSLTILLQKLQPIMVAGLAYLFLKERPKEGFYGWALVALAAAIVLSFPTFDFSFLSGGLDLRSRGVLYAIGAASLWALATVVGKTFVGSTHPQVVTFWRYAFGLAALMTLATLAGNLGEDTAKAYDVFSSGPLLGYLVYTSLVPGLIAMIAYYAGLSRTPAMVTTFVELLYPVSAVAINAVFLKSALDPVQIGAAALLLFAVTMISVKQ